MKNYNRRKNIIFIFENILYFGLIIVLFNNVLGLKEEFLSMNIHPLFILTGIMAYRYGVHLGIISATIATIIYMYVYVELGKDFVVFFYDFKYYKFLLMFYTFAFILGRIKDNQSEKIKEFQDEISIFHKNFKKITENNKKLVFINNRMKDQIIKAEKSIIALYNISKNLDVLELDSLMTNLIAVYKNYINAETLSIYEYDKEKKILELTLVAGENRRLPEIIKVDEYPEFKKIIKNKKVSKREGKDLKIPVFFGPIIKDEEVIGIINIERLSYESYTDYTEKLFEILVNWMNKSITNAYLYWNTMKDKMYYKNTNILKLEFFDRRLREEKKRGELYEMPYLVLKFKVLVSDLSKINLNLRKIDRVGYDEKNKVISVLLPVTKLEKKSFFLSKFLEENKGILEEYYED